jgi:ABC-type transporter Mla MlaB component
MDPGSCPLPESRLTVSHPPRPRRVLDAPMLLGLSTREGFRRAANSLLGEMGVGNGELVIDLGATKEVDSSGLGALVLVQRHAAERRQQVVLRGVGPELEYLLVLTKLDDLFQFEAR